MCLPKTGLGLALLLCLTLPALAQKNELSVAAGGYFPIDSTVGAGDAFALEGTFAHRLGGVPFVALYVELPVVGSFSSHLPTSFFSPASYSAFFLTPGAKLKFASSTPISPWVAVGGGWARFSKNSNLAAASGSSTTNTGVFDIGGGVDAKIAPYLSVRGELRDFYTGDPALLIPTGNREHNLVATVGLVLRF